MTQPIEVTELAAGLSAVYIPRAMDPRQVRALRARLGVVCRHGDRIRSTYGRCPACRAAKTNQESA